MPTIKTVSVTYGRKFNLGDYESVHIEISIWADVEEDEDLNEVMPRLWDMAKANVKAQALPLVQKNQAQVEQIMMGLPVETREAITGDKA